MEMNQTILSACGLYRDFKTTEGILPVLKGISLEVAKGEMVAITGASGVGKSTLLHLLGGLDRPTSGQVTLVNVDLSTCNEAALARFRNENVGFVFQHHYLMDDFSALENVMIPMLLGGVSRSEAKARGELLLEEVVLSDRRSHRPREMSGGEQQRVAVARALANNPEVVLADEPSGNLDTATGKSLHNLLESLNREKKVTFLVATHNRELANSCDREYVMKDGTLSVSE